MRQPDKNVMNWLPPRIRLANQKAEANLQFSQSRSGRIASISPLSLDSLTALFRLSQRIRLALQTLSTSSSSSSIRAPRNLHPHIRARNIHIRTTVQRARSLAAHFHIRAPLALQHTP